MEYRELTIKTDTDHLELLEAELIENGFTSMMISDPEVAQDIIEHPDIYRYDYLSEEIMQGSRPEPSVTLYFADDAEGLAEFRRAGALLNELKAGPDGLVLSYVDRNAGDDSEWLYRWQEYFKPAKVGSRIVVKPSWEEYAAGDDEIVIEMDPGMAFGSGLHETTSLCIRALERILQEMKGVGEEDIRVLDVGTGTGILAIASVLLGADEALGIDIDPEAVRVANENIEKNGMSGRITAQYGDLTEGVDYRADILVANLMADLVVRFSQAAVQHLDAAGWYVTSGILDIKEEEVSEAIRSAGFVIEDVMHDGEWCAVIARRA